jgi:pimeloyl-ACP methyl ester carboxylesterase
MNALLLVLVALPPAAAPAAKVDTLLEKVAPAKPAARRTPGQDRVVVLIHGLGLHPIAKDRAGRATLRSWQKGDSVLVKELARHADVYALSYGQVVAVDKVPEAIHLADRVRDLRKAGYRDVVLVGHSAGGLIARQLVEDHPDLGVSKVIQVCAPNTGSALAAVRAARDAQVAFLVSLGRAARTAFLARRSDLRIPTAVQFACVVAVTTPLGGDGIVSTRSQWSDDLQKQGIPAYLLRATHRDAVRSARAAELIARLVRDAQPRWKADEVARARKKLLGSRAREN